MDYPFLEHLSILGMSFLGFITGGPLKKRAEARLHMYQGKKHYFRKDFQLAWKKFLIAESLFPNDFDVQFYLANTYYQMKRFDYAYDHIQKFKQIKGEENHKYHTEMELLLANINALLGQKETSIEILENILKEHDEKLQKAKEKNEKIDKVTQQNLDNIRYITNKNLGDIYFHESKHDEAIERYNKALEIEETSDLYFYKGFLEFSRDAYDRAVEEFSKAIELGFSSEEIFFKRAYSYFKLQELKKAKEDLRTLIMAYPEGEHKVAAESFLDTIRSFR